MMVQRTNLRHRYAGICKSHWYVGRHQCTRANGMLVSPQCVRCDIGLWGMVMSPGNPFRGTRQGWVSGAKVLVISVAFPAT